MTALLCTLQNPTNQEAEGRAAPHRADTARTARAHSPRRALQQLHSPRLRALTATQAGLRRHLR